MTDADDLSAQIQQMKELLQLQLEVQQSQVAQNAAGTNTGAATGTLANTATSIPRVKQVKVPEGRYQMTRSELRTYKKDCQDFKKLTKLADDDIVLQLRLNMDADLKRAVDVNYGSAWDDLTLEDAIKNITKIVQQTSNEAVFQKEFHNMTQKTSEPINEFLTRLRDCAADCGFTCPFSVQHDLTDYHILQRLRSGLHDRTLQQEILQKASTLTTITAIVDYCENFEAAKRDNERLTKYSDDSNKISYATGSSDNETVGAISNYKKHKSYNEKSTPTSQRKAESCYYCGYKHQRRQVCPAKGKKCTKCQKSDHFAQVCRQGNASSDISSNAATIDVSTDGVIISTIIAVNEPSPHSSHKLPMVKVSIGLQINDVYTTTDAVPDTGAQVSVAGPQLLSKLDLPPYVMDECSRTINHVGGGRIVVAGCINIYISHNGMNICEQVYIVEGIDKLFLSLNACRYLGFVHKEFPFATTDKSPDRTRTTQPRLPIRPGLPTRPQVLPFPACEENIPKLKQWLLDAFTSTTFNTTTTPLPVMNCKPYEIKLTEQYHPYHANVPIPVPYHWKDKVKKQLDDDEALGIIRKVPQGRVTEWCMRMVIVSKKDGEPRRTVDFQPLNKYSKREVHYTEPPFRAVSSIPLKTYKSSCDAKNGYHQVSLAESSIDLTTFITPWGRYQYLRVPQGHVSSGDAYTRRYDDIITDVLRKRKIIDDIALYDPCIETAFYHMFDFLSLSGSNGITQNPKKFKFCQRELEFAGFLLGWETFRPGDDKISAIRNYPMPPQPSITDIRSWFGLVNQLSPFLALAPIMEPFRELLKPDRRNAGKKVFWDGNMQSIFEKTREELCTQINEGLSFFDATKPSAIVTDWSKEGIGFILFQKHCSCEETVPFCCTNGWRTILCGSRHLEPRERNYAPIEGEGLAVSWAMKKAKMYLIGDSNFTVVVDHKPLLRIFGDRSLADIDNTRLFKFKERTLPYSFTMKHIPGAYNSAANALSRAPVNFPDEDDMEDIIEVESTACITINAVTTDRIISPDDIRGCAKTDCRYQKLLEKVSTDSFASVQIHEAVEVRDFFNVRDRLSIIDGLLMYCYEDRKPRFVVPVKLRPAILNNLHKAHQGCTSMLGRARTSVYWPGLEEEIKIVSTNCADCRTNAPSHQQEPLITTPPPEYPMQHVVADMFEHEGRHYLAYACRLTGWVELAFFASVPPSSSIEKTIREFFHR